MKKHLTKLITLLLALVMSFSVFSGCALISTVQDKDMEQVVAKVKISDDVDETVIYKRDLVSSFNSYGYTYVYYYGYSVEETLNLLADSLVQNAIVIQYAKTELAEYYNELKNGVAVSDFDTAFSTQIGAAKQNQTLNAKSDLDLFLTEYEVAYANYQTQTGIDSIIESYAKEEETESEEEKESVTITDRTAPVKEEETAREELTEAELKETVPTDTEYKIANKTLKLDENEEVTVIKATYTNLYDLNYAVYTTYKFDISDKADKKALNKGISALKDSGIIPSTENYSANDVLKYTYFKEALESQKEALVVSKYEDYLNDTIEKELDVEALYDEYVAMYQTQKGSYETSISDYETALEAVSEDSFLVYNQYAGYGHVAHILISFSEEQKAAIEAKKAEENVTNAQIDAYKKQLLDSLVVTDLRKSWVQNNHGTYDEANATFTFEDDYLYSADLEDATLKTKAMEKLSVFGGDIIGATSSVDKDENDLSVTTWTFENVIPEKMPFVLFYQNYLTDILGMNEVYYAENDASTIATIDLTDDVYNVFKDVMFAFSDANAGGFDTEFGFLYSPSTSATTYVKQFANAARDLVNQGIGAYSIVGTEYGYHIMVCTNKVAAGNDQYVEDKALFLSDIQAKEGDAYRFRNVKLEAIQSSEVSVKASSFIKNFKDDIKINKGVYKDLF